MLRVHQVNHLNQQGMHHILYSFWLTLDFLRTLFLDEMVKYILFNIFSNCNNNKNNTSLLLLISPLLSQKGLSLVSD